MSSVIPNDPNDVEILESMLNKNGDNPTGKQLVMEAINSVYVNTLNATAKSFSSVIFIITQDI